MLFVDIHCSFHAVENLGAPQGLPSTDKSKAHLGLLYISGKGPQVGTNGSGFWYWPEEILNMCPCKCYNLAKLIIENPSGSSRRGVHVEGLLFVTPASEPLTVFIIVYTYVQMYK